jgi:nitroreductase
MFDLDQAIRERRSTRMFLPRPVPRDLVNEALALAQWAPSNSNIQPWRLVLVSGAARDRLKDALFKVADRDKPDIPPLPKTFEHYRKDALFKVVDHDKPDIPPLPKAFEHYRYELGAEVYGSMGITIADTARHEAAVMRNFDFFGAPLVGIVSMHRELGPADAVSVGMYLQTLILALTARGLGTCVEVSVAGYHDVVRDNYNGLGRRLYRPGLPG